MQCASSSETSARPPITRSSKPREPAIGPSSRATPTSVRSTPATIATASIILLRHVNELTPDQQARLLIANLDEIADELDLGAVVAFDRTRIRVRRLPISREA